MLKVTVTNKLTQIITNQAQFDTQDQVDSWISSQEEVQAFGKPEHQKEITPAVIHPDTGEIAEEAVYETIPDEYTIEVEDITAEVEKRDRIAQKIAIGQITDKACNDVFMLIQGYNVERQLTSEQKTEMTNLFLPALQAIQVRRPSQLKQYISSITPDGTLVTEEMKSDILELLSNF